MDSIMVTPKQETFAPGVDYMTDYDSWLFIQVNGRCAFDSIQPSECRISDVTRLNHPRNTLNPTKFVLSVAVFPSLQFRNKLWL